MIAIPADLHPDDRAAIEGYRAWRMGPWRGRAERFDLVAVSDLGLARAFVLELWADGIYLAGALALALESDPPPRSLDGRPSRRKIARAVLAAGSAAVEPERRAIAADLAELVEHLRERRRAAS